MKRILALLLAVSVLLSCAACGGRNTASAMSLTKTEGDVEVTDDSDKDVSIRDDLRLYSGYQVRTRKESYAWIDLDRVKLAKLDQQSRVELEKEGKELELTLRSGSVFFNVTKPLEEDESMTIRTSTMAVGIRGTCGWVEYGEEICRVYILEGKVRCRAGGAESVSVSAGEMAELKKGAGEIRVAPFTQGDIPAFVWDEVEDEDELLEAVGSGGGGDASGWEWPTVSGWEPNGTPEGGDTAGEDAGTEGNISWSIRNGVLTISGTGDMEDYVISYDQPWYGREFHTLVIQPGVTSVGSYTFIDCEGLTKVTLPNTVTTIGELAFASCNALTSVNIPASVTTIGDSAFRGCKSLPDVDIPYSVTSIGSGAFEDCESLTSVTIPGSVISIGSCAFLFCEGLTEVVIENGVTSIGEGAFDGCDKLTRVEIPNSVTSIGEKAFYRCWGLTRVNIPTGLTVICASTFSKCIHLDNVVVPEGVTSIEDWAFGDCQGMTNITIPASVTTISYRAFETCTHLTDIYFTGSRAQFDSISVDPDNYWFFKAEVHCNA